MSQTADLVLFTSGADSYVAEVVRHLDPLGDLFTATLSRSDCTAVGTGGAREPIYKKDLISLGRPLAG